MVSVPLLDGSQPLCGPANPVPPLMFTRYLEGKTLRRLICVFFALVLALAASSAACAQQLVDRIAAAVNGEVITLFDVDSKVKPLVDQALQQNPAADMNTLVRQFRNTILQSMINDILLKQEADRLQVEVTEAEIENHIRDIKEKQGLTEEALLNKLALQGLSREEYTKMVREQIVKHRLIGFMVHRKVLVSDEDIDKYIAGHGSTPGLSSSDTATNKSVRFELLVLPTDKDPGKVLAEVNSGEKPFASAVAEYSVGPGKENGGDLGVFEWKDLGPELREALSGLSVGQISQPFSLQGQTAMVRMKELDAPGSAPSSPSSGASAPDASREEIRQILEQQMIEAQFQHYIEKLRGKAVIKVNI